MCIYFSCHNNEGEEIHKNTFLDWAPPPNNHQFIAINDGLLYLKVGLSSLERPYWPLHFPPSKLHKWHVLSIVFSIVFSVVAIGCCCCAYIVLYRTEKINMMVCACISRDWDHKLSGNQYKHHLNHHHVFMHCFRCTYGKGLVSDNVLLSYLWCLWDDFQIYDSIVLPIWTVFDI